MMSGKELKVTLGFLVIVALYVSFLVWGPVWRPKSEPRAIEDHAKEAQFMEDHTKEAQYWLEILRSGFGNYEVCLEFLRQEVQKGGLTLEDIGTSEEELEKLRTATVR